ncbi:NAD(P)/FAD-dependent oxidoreductase [Mesorhizobium sp. M1148]|uniref:NAD(P)/FAD-dependent oxidoreductase n=1 Tax=unclassified Mesorhizobium TaxID=325217 RepID=UPI0003CF8424|nr:MULTISPECIES: NAD(P)/FAD-dependent oxidoreductase [unclassified Mesorhizobium]ESX30587.1 FAD-dependent oxidoreductase [Mesorhizobium sp. LSHC440B00]ESX37220.1 FAD-dependent oxidoreductase [Mesorhizobium sp. LSHC432A00]ESX77205.1 FAD-dependent oxidoreductase [Mesorhizobium sp. LSHC414A00]ESY40597.1 FAD-dependent oxidoreductase [Mesorhizobium sp. LNJC384A00]WJI57742.1 NAD(P)/FAD-dependent oxidoreductase [Mesorhizobium sp. C432A]
MHDVDCVVAGAGVVGLAIARALALSGREVLVVEKAAAIGTGTSSRNSEVIHAGLHYTPGSLKARLCVNGRERLYAYCREHDVAHHRTGKLIVAVEPDQLDKLQAIQINAAQCGVGDLTLLTRAEAESLEPALSCAGALLSPSTGIVDNQALMLSLRGDAEAAGASFALLTGVSGASIEADGIRINTRDADGEGFTLKTGAFINAAGLDAQALAGRIEGLPQDRVPPLWLARGNYFALSGRSPFSRLIYPVPVHGGLGVHLTLDMSGSARFGPDVEWIDRVDDTVDPARGAAFYDEIRRYWSGLADGALQPAYAGVRPKLSGPGQPAADFVIQGPADHGGGQIVNLFGIESPGLTASLAIAEHVVGLLYPNDGRS